MPYWGESWSLISAVFWAIAVVLFRVAVKGIPPIEMSLFKNTFALILFIATWLLFQEQDVETNLSNKDLLVLVSAGGIGIALGDTLFMYALNILGAGRNAILSCLFSPFVILLSVLFLKEEFSVFQALGFILILSGILLAVYQKSSDIVSKRNRIVGTIVGIFAVFCMATGMVITKPILNEAPPAYVSCFRLAGGLLGVVLFTIASGRIRTSIRIFKGPLPWKIMLLGAFIGTYLALFTWIVGFKHTSTSVASILNQTSVFFIIILAVPILKERLSLMKIAGASLGFLGVTLILYHA
ncbi:MAG: DMT family transporter [Verrucomicrobia bacterium]|nr:DMT family transporter [Verrucomicrobiota bacterium]MDA1069714.1 DMT family transporter [Verrucomicrobiota bacterium]